MAATPPGARKPPNRDTKTGFSLNGLDLGAAGDLVDPGTLALLGIQQQNPPEQAPVAGGGGILSTLLAGIGGGLIGQPGAGAGLIQQQQEQIAATEAENRQLLQAHREQTLGLIKSGIDQKRQNAKDAKDATAEALAIERQVEHDKGEQLIRKMRAETERMRQQGILDDKQADNAVGSITSLIFEAGDTSDQINTLLGEKDNLTFRVGITNPETGQDTFYNSPEELRIAYNGFLGDLLNQIQDQAGKAEVKRLFDEAFGPIENKLKRYEQRVASLAKKTDEDRDQKPRTGKKRPPAKTLTGKIVEGIRSKPRRTFSTPKGRRAAFEGDF